MCVCTLTVRRGNLSLVHNHPLKFSQNGTKSEKMSAHFFRAHARSRESTHAPAIDSMGRSSPIYSATISRLVKVIASLYHSRLIRQPFRASPPSTLFLANPSLLFIFVVQCTTAPTKIGVPKIKRVQKIPRETQENFFYSAKTVHVRGMHNERRLTRTFATLLRGFISEGMASCGMNEKVETSSSETTVASRGRPLYGKEIRS